MHYSQLTPSWLMNVAYQLVPCNIANSWFIGSITLLIVKGDEKNGEYRDALATLEQYSHMHHFDDSFKGKLKTQLQLQFRNREIVDEQVLKNFPNAMRRKVLRRLYLPFLSKTKLMKGVRQQFVDAFLSSCTVEIFTPGEEIVERGSIMSDLFLLVGGIAEITTRRGQSISKTEHSDEDPSHRSGTSTVKDEGPRPSYEQLEAGDFIGEIGFFTESPQVDSVACVTVCKTLTLSRNAYKMILQDHPNSAGKVRKRYTWLVWSPHLTLTSRSHDDCFFLLQILQNLLNQVEQTKLSLPKSLASKFLF
jgi:CRP-like cAMP-binding protein